MRRHQHRHRQTPDRKPPLRGTLVIVGFVPCVLCGRALSQDDVIESNVMGLGEMIPDTRYQDNMVLFCRDHFYTKVGEEWQQAADYEAHLEMLALVVVERLKAEEGDRA